VPGDYVIATGRAHSVGDFVRTAFEAVGLDHGDHVSVDPDLVGRFDIDTVVGDPDKAHRILGWSAQTPFHDMVAAMVRAELAAA
jgi:GDPmannose 4,6-dehydratase